MTTCKHKLQKATGSGPGWQTWRCVDCRRSVIQTEDGKEQTLTELVAERADFANSNHATRRLTCNICDADISSPVPSDTVVRAWCECMECVEGKPDINDALAHLRAIVDASLGYAETADAIIEAARWLRKIDGEVVP